MQCSAVVVGQCCVACFTSLVRAALMASCLMCVHCSLFTVCVVQGNRATVPARCGQTLLDAAVMHKVDIEHPCEGKSSFV